MRGIGPLLGLAVMGRAVAGQGRAAGPEATPPAELTAEQDHQRLMELLRITSLRPGADGRNPQAPNAANYDEAKANPFPGLPDPLRLTRSSSWDTWTTRRIRP